MSCSTFTYENISPDRFAELTAKAAESGLQLLGPSGEATIDHCTLRYTYDGTSLFITCTGKPFYVSCDTIKEHLDSLISAQ